MMEFEREGVFKGRIVFPPFAMGPERAKGRERNEEIRERV